MNVIEKLKKASKIIIWGFSRGQLNNPPIIKASHLIFDYCNKNDIWKNVIFCVDSKDIEQGINIYGKTTYHPSVIKEHKDAIVIINNFNQPGMVKAAQNLGLTNELVFVPYHFLHNYIEGMYPAGTYNGMDYYTYMRCYIDEIKNMYEKNDDITDKKLRVMSKMTEIGEDSLFQYDFYGDTGKYHDYFCEETLEVKGDVTLVDIGAYIGDSIEPVRAYYGSRLKKMYAFEPDENNRNTLISYIQKKELELITSVYDCALGAENGYICFDSHEATSYCKAEGKNKIQIKKFDDVYSGHIGSLMIKMDIEGQELNALKGMENVIKEQHPYLAICIYHKLGDIFEIPQYIRSIYSGYKFYLRGGWHLECWAVPDRKR